MNKRFYLFIAIFVFFFLISSVSAQNTDISGSDNEKEIPAKSIVRGRIFYADTGKPMRRGWVALVKVKMPEQDDLEDTSDFLGNFNHPSGSSSEYALTDDNGEFIIKDLEAGTYYPTFKVAGVLNPEAFNRIYRNLEISLEEFDQLFQKVTVDGYSQVQVNIGARRGGAISGRISYSDGEPAIGIRVEAIRKMEGEFESVTAIEPISGEEDTVNITKTDDTGFYRFAGLPAGEYIVRISESSIHQTDDFKANKWNISKLTHSSELKTYFPDAVNPKFATPLKVNLSQENSSINIVLPDRRLFKVSGIVAAKDNKIPFKYAQIGLEKIDVAGFERTSESKIQSAADEHGRWALKDLPTGKYKLTVKPPEVFNREESDKTEYAEITREIEIKENDLQDIVIELPIAASISGTIIFEDKKAVTEYTFVYASDKEKNLFSYQTFNNSNENEKLNKSSYNFQLKSLSEGKFFISVSCIDKCYPKSIIFGDKDYLAAPIELKDGQSISGLKIVLAADTGTLKGKVRNDQNNPAEFVDLLLIPADPGKLKAAALYRNDKTTKDGRFQINAAPGEYFIVFPQEEDSEMTDDEFLEKRTKDAERVTIKSNETTTINLSLPN